MDKGRALCGTLEDFLLVTADALSLLSIGVVDWDALIGVDSRASADSLDHKTRQQRPLCDRHARRCPSSISTG